MLAQTRRLAAIMFTDMVRYSALTQHDETLALRLVSEQSAILRPLFSAHGGRVVKSMGDGFLVEFGSALEAAACALEVREKLAEYNRENPGARLDLRIGIHVGDVIERGGDVFGDAVNVASRVEPLADQGGICVSQAVYEQVANKLDVTFTRLDRATLKNIEFPWSVFRLEPRRRLNGTPVDARVALPLVERIEELQHLRGAVFDLREGVGGVVILAGEAGIGKTRLLEELSRAARQEGVLVATGRAHEGDFEPPLAPWLEALRGLVFEIPPAELLQDVGLQAMVLGPFLPDLLLRLGAPATAPGYPEPERFVLFEAITRLLVNVSKQRPLLLCLEDLHWADEASLKLLEFVNRNTSGERVLCIGSYRSEELERNSRLGSTIYELNRIRRLDHLSLGPLSESGVATLAAAALGVESIDPVLLTLLQRRAGGNPLFIAELAWALRSESRLAIAEGRAVLTGEPIQLPRTVQPLIERRICRLSPATQELLRKSSILGARFESSALEKLVGGERSAFLESVEEALRSGVLRETPINAESLLSFVDSRIREYLYETVSFLRRRALHREAAELLQARGASADELAYHFDQARQVAIAGRFFEKAGDEALALGDYDRATDRFDRALASHPPEHKEERRRIGVKLGRALQESGHYPEATRALLEARRAVDEPAEDAAIATWLSAVYLREGRLEESHAEIASALRALGDREDPEAADAWSGLCVLLMTEGRPKEAIEAGKRTLAIAQRLGAPELVYQGYNNLTYAYLSDAQWEPAVECVMDRLERPDEGVRPYESAITLHDAANVFTTVLSDYTHGLEYFDRAVDRFHRMGIGAEEVDSRLGRAHALVELGRWADAEREIEVGSRLARDRKVHGASAFFEVLRGELAWFKGDYRTAESHCRKALEEAPERMEFRQHLEIQAHLLLGLIRADLGDGAGARAEIAPWWGAPAPHRCGRCGGFGSFVAACAESVDPTGDSAVLEEALEHARTKGVRLVQMLIAGPHARWKRLHGEPSEGQLREAESFFRAVGTRPFLAATLLEHAATLEALGQAEEGRRFRDEALGIYRELGALERAGLAGASLPAE